MFYFHDSTRWIKKELATFYVKACALFLKSFVVPALLFSPLICLAFVSVYDVRQHSNFTAKEPAPRRPRGCSPFPVPRLRRERRLPTRSPAVPVITSYIVLLFFRYLPHFHDILLVSISLSEQFSCFVHCFIAGLPQSSVPPFLSLTLFLQKDAWSKDIPEILVVPREKTPTGAAARGNP